MRFPHPDNAVPPRASSADGARASRFAALAICFGVPVALLTLSYVWLAVSERTPWLWDVHVHESGRYTLGETVFYFRHFLRELPVDFAMALFMLAAFARSGGVAGYGRARLRRAVLGRWVPLVGLVLLVGSAVLAVAGRLGWSEVIHELLQYRTRDNLSSFGSHWRFHWLSTIWFGAAAAVVAPWVTRLCGGGARQVGPRALLFGAWIFVVALTCVFGLSGEIFVDARYAGHQAREILTHGPVTCLLGFGILHLSAAWMTGTRGSPAPPNVRRTQSGILEWCLVVVVPLYLAAMTLRSDVLEAGQSEHGLAAMVGAHFFEHVLDYVTVALLLIAGNSWLLTSERSPR